MPRRIEITTADLAGALLTVAFLAGWLALGEGHVSEASLASCGLVAGSFVAAGAAALSVAGWRGSAAYPLKFLVGFFLVNTLVFALVWIAPLSLLGDFLLVVAGLACLFAVRRVRLVTRPNGDEWAPIAATTLTLVSASLWAQDSLRPTSIVADKVIFKPWVDSFYHAIHINLFSRTGGPGTVEDYRMAFVPAQLYHYASYITPAILKVLTRVSAFTAFTAILVPLGLTLTGFAAFALAESLGGVAAGLAATAALLLLPDLSQLGLGNAYFGYHWLQAIGPGGLYGTAAVALAWLLVLRACSVGTRAPLFAGWGIAALAIAYKAQLFFASALMLWILPPLFMKELAPRQRLAWLLAALLTFVLAVAYSQCIESMPLIRPDGSSIRDYFQLMASVTGPSRIASWFTAHTGIHVSLLDNVGYGIPYLVVSVVGPWLVAYGILAITLRRRVDRLWLMLPALALVNFLAMALGLALDDRGVGTVEELTHRPFVLVYFIFVVWVGGALGRAMADPVLVSGRGRALAMVAVPLLAVPLHFGKGVQHHPNMPTYSDTAVSRDLVAAADFVREHARPAELLQDSHNDTSGVVMMISERRAYVREASPGTRMGIERVHQRAQVVSALLAEDKMDGLTTLAQAIHVRWMLLHPGDRVAWPASVLDHPRFVAGGLRVYRLW